MKFKPYAFFGLRNKYTCTVYTMGGSVATSVEYQSKSIVMVQINFACTCDHTLHNELVMDNIEML